VEQQQVQVTMPTVQVTVRQQGGQELQELFRTPVNSSFVDHKLEQLYGPGALRLEGSNAVLAATEELQPAEAYVYQVSAAGAGAAVIHKRPEYVHLSIEGSGAPHTLDIALTDGRVNLNTIKDYLTIKKLSLATIDGRLPVADSDGNSLEQYTPGATLKIQADPKPGVKVATAYDHAAPKSRLLSPWT
jgi:hypothetical protein